MNLRKQQQILKDKEGIKGWKEKAPERDYENQKVSC